MRLQEPPQVSPESIAELAMRHWRLEGPLARERGERDANYRIGPSHIVKLVNAEEAASASAMVQAFHHISICAPALPVARPLPTRDGSPFATLADGVTMLVYERLPGEPLGIVAHDRALLRSLGAAAGELGRALRGFAHPALIDRDLVWNTARAGGLLAAAGALPPGDDRELAYDVLARMANDIAPELLRLRAQVTHSDLHQDNLLIDKGQLSGIVDFGDMVHAPLVIDIANMTADFLHLDGDPEALLRAVIGGYCSAMPLEEAEADLLLPLVETRLVMAPVIAAASGRHLDGAFAKTARSGFDLIRHLRNGAGGALRSAAGFSRPPRPSATLDAMLSRRRAVHGQSLSLFYDPPIHIVRGEGLWLTDADGRRYLDCYNNVPHVGHCHPVVANAIAAQARALNTNTRYITDEAVEYAERLIALSPAGFDRVLYVNSGSEANDVAWRIAKVASGHRGGLAMHHAYHGITDAIDGFSPSNNLEGLVPPHMRTLTAPDGYRGPYHHGEARLGERYADLADGPIAELDAAGLGVAACIIDSTFMSSGMIDAPQGYVAHLAAKVRAAGGLFVGDEVQSGFGRMGSGMWGSADHHGVVPDIITIGKPAGNGHPLGVIITRSDILDRFTQEVFFFSTFGGNNVSCAAGIAVLDVIRDEHLIANARVTGAALKTALTGLMAKHPIIGEVRGNGFAIGVDLVTDARTRAPASAECQRLLNLARDEGVFFGREGPHGNVIKIRPPMVFGLEHVAIAVSALDRALSRL